MSLYQRIVGGIVMALWLGLYVAATAIDRSLESLAQSVTPVALVVVGAVLGSAGIKLLRGDREPDDKP